MQINLKKKCEAEHRKATVSSKVSLSGESDVYFVNTGVCAAGDETFVRQIHEVCS